MSDDKNTNDAKPTHQELDWFLQILVDIANRANTKSYGVTLNVHGLIVSGILVGVKKYFEGLSQDIAKGHAQAGGSPDTTKEIQELFAKLGGAGKANDQDEENTPLPQFIHLEDAKFFFGAQQPIPSNQGTRWRGRISEVDGFVFGTLSIGNS